MSALNAKKESPLYFVDGIEFDWKHEDAMTNWLCQIVEMESGVMGGLNFILTSDKKLLEINKKFLNHDYYTDVITFQSSPDLIEGDIYMSLDRIQENAKEIGDSFQSELLRVMAHGLLHMIGYSDKSDDEKKEIRSKEDFYLNLRDF